MAREALRHRCRVKLLLPGYSRVLGRHLAGQALAQGRAVTLRHCGRSGSDLFARAQRGTADRDGDQPELCGPVRSGREELDLAGVKVAAHADDHWLLRAHRLQQPASGDGGGLHRISFRGGRDETLGHARHHGATRPSRTKIVASRESAALSLTIR